MNRTRVVVVFRLSSTPRLVRQTVPIEDLRDAAWEPPSAGAKRVPAPTFAEARAVDCRP